jgi:hypothetical protein
MSAAASTKLFDKRALWLESCFPDKHVVNSDRICVNKCVKIEYKGKWYKLKLYFKIKFKYFSLTIPINNSCPGCPENHVDLSIPAWLWFEPNYKIGRIISKRNSFFYIKVINFKMLLSPL